MRPAVERGTRLDVVPVDAEAVVVDGPDRAAHVDRPPHPVARRRTVTTG